MREHIRRVSRLALILLANVALLVALLVVIEGLSGYAFFLNDLVPRLRESNLSHTGYDAEIGWVGLPNVDIEDMYGPGAHLRTNGKGFRTTKNFRPKRNSDTRRIVCSGDSVTFGEHVGNEQTFCSVLTELDPKLETINMGQVGYGVDQAYLWYRRDASDLEVDVHVFAFITHDFVRMRYDKFMGIPRPVVILEDGKLVVANVPISESTYAMPVWLAEILNGADGLRTVKLATAARAKLNLAPKKVPGAWDARGAEEVKTVVARLFEELRDYDFARSRATVLVYFPSVEELQQPNAELEYWMSVVESNARRLDIPFINFVSLFAELPAADVTRLFVDGYHFSEWGNALVARELHKHLQDDAQTAGQQSTDGQPTALPAGKPYRHVVPSDVGKTIGVGVTAPVPTAIYTGPNPVTRSNTTIENVVVNDCLIIGDADSAVVDNVTVRNVIVNCDSHYGLTVTNANNVTVVNSKIDNTTDGKAVYVPYDATDIHFEKNEITGGQDFFFFHDRVADVYVENNYMHHLVGGPDAHADGFQWWPDVGNGAFYIRGNYITMNNPTIGANDILFSGDGGETVLFENNYLGVWGYYTLRWYGEGAKLTARYNVYEQAFKTAFPADGWPSHALCLDPNDGQGGSIYRCNRYEDGSFIEQQYLMSDNGSPVPTHDITGCPTYP